jgi:hypothetical protein
VTEPPAKDALEDVLRPNEVPEDLVFLLRAGAEDDVDLLKRQALRLDRRYSFEGAACFGVSVFAATEENEPWVLATKMDVRRRYYRLRYRDVANLRLRLLPTFNAPHWTVLFNGPDGPEYQAFIDALGEIRDNPYWKRRPGRRTR